MSSHALFVVQITMRLAHQQITDARPWWGGGTSSGGAVEVERGQKGSGGGRVHERLTAIPVTNSKYSVRMKQN